MGLVIRIDAYADWTRTYFVQELDVSEAKRKAFDMFKKTVSCYLPETVEEAETDDAILIEVIGEVEQIIL